MFISGSFAQVIAGERKETVGNKCSGEKKRRRQPLPGKRCLGTRQIKVVRCDLSAEKKEVVKLALLAPAAFLLIGREPLVAEIFHGLA